MADESNRVREIFLAAIEQHAPEEWPGFLDEICAQEPAVRGKVERLLRAQAQLGTFHEVMKPAPTATLDEPFREGPCTLIGPYKLLEQIGEGGMGLVFMAEQTKPVRRRVALKVIKPGMDTRHVVARFEAERQALALMDHPNSPMSSTAAPPIRAGPISSWSWSAACPSPSSATSAGSRRDSDWNCLSPSARRYSTPTKRASSTAI